MVTLCEYSIKVQICEHFPQPLILERRRSVVHRWSHASLCIGCLIRDSCSVYSLDFQELIIRGSEFFLSMYKVEV